MITRLIRLCVLELQYVLRKWNEMVMELGEEMTITLHVFTTHKHTCTSSEYRNTQTDSSMETHKIILRK